LPAFAAELVQIRGGPDRHARPSCDARGKGCNHHYPNSVWCRADPVRLGLVASLNQPGGNLTGFSQFNAELEAKALALLHDLVPSTATIGFLQNPDNPIIDELLTRDVLAAAPAIALRIQMLKAATDQEIDAAFESLIQARTGALLVGNDA